jgi:hypothetical protein
MQLRSFVVALLILVVSAAGAAAQGTQTGTLRGWVRTPDKASVPGVTVTITSPALQAARTTLTEEDGSFIFRGLPPGRYTVSVSRETFKPFTQEVDVPLGASIDLPIELALAGVTETVTVQADVSTVVSSPTGLTNIPLRTIQNVPTTRTPVTIASLAPAVTMNTPNANQLTINGAFAYDNVFLINGIDVNDNLFGSPQRLFIEDAIQETQVLTSGISAEFGRFGGGVVNVITKSGGNNFSGSFRANLSNPRWSTRTPFDVDSGVTFDSVYNDFYEGTLGGPILRDRVWFFGAGRLANASTPETFDFTGIEFTQVNNNRRGEIKLTTTPVMNHTFQFNYINNHTTVTQPPFGFSIDPATIYSGRRPNWIAGGTWRGLILNELFIEAGYSTRRFSFLGEGGTLTDIMESPIIGLSELVHYNAPYFDATDPESRNNQQLFGTASYSASWAGRHDLKAGLEWFRSTRTGGNSQSATNFVFDADYATDPVTGDPLFDAGGRLIPTFVFGETLLENWLPIRGARNDTDVTSLFLQDHWAVNSKLSFDLGVRFEAARSEATGGILGVNTSTVVPRLAMSYDPTGQGEWLLHTTYAHYAGKYNETLIGANNNVGNPDVTLGVYVGPEGQGRDFAPGFDPANYVTVFGRFPTANVTVADGLSSPVTREFTVGAGRIFRRGDARVTYVWRNTDDFIDDVIDIANGTTTVVRDDIEFGTFSNIVYTNTNVPDRRYQSLVFQGNYRLRPEWTLSGNWTIQLENDGSFEGEATNQPGIPGVFNDYLGPDGQPLIYTADRHFPDGRLGAFQRHKIRVWTVYTWNLNRWGSLTTAGLLRYDSPLHYSLVATGQPLSTIQEDLLLAAGYPDAPSSQAIFFGPRGSERFNAVTLVDGSLTYDIGTVRNVRPFVKMDVYNLFNNQRLLTFNTTIVPDWEGPLDELGLPTTFDRGPRFGEAVSAGNFATPFQGQTGGRTFVFAAGIRF